MSLVPRLHSPAFITLCIKQQQTNWGVESVAEAPLKGILVFYSRKEELGRRH